MVVQLCLCYCIYFIKITITSRLEDKKIHVKSVLNKTVVDGSEVPSIMSQKFTVPLL